MHVIIFVMSQTVLIAGSSGFLGSRLMDFLEKEGFRVVPVLRRRGEKGEPFWSLQEGVFDPGDHRSFDILINLAGENIAEGRWTEKKKKSMERSRVESNQLFTAYISKMSDPPSLFISASAIGYYGDRGFEKCTETSGRGEGYLADLVTKWEKSILGAGLSKTRCVCLRTGIVLDREAGPLKKMLLPFKLMLGGKLGSGIQMMSWISTNDYLRATLWIIEKGLSGPVNISGPNPVSNKDFTRSLASAINRPALFNVPGVVLKILLGGMAEELLLYGTNVIPQALISSGFQFRDPNLKTYLEKELSV